MRAIQMTPQRYLEILDEYDLILAHAHGMSDRLTGRTVVEKHLSYAETIFTKLLCHAISLRKLSPTLRPFSGSELWDISSCCAVARTLIEAFDALAYVSLHPVSALEREFRLLIWELHDKEHRLHMLEEIGASGLDVDAIRSDTKILRNLAVAHTFFNELSNDVKKMIVAGKAPAYLRSKKERNVAGGINHNYYNSVTMFLSQYVHTLPFALSQLELSHAGDPGALQVMAMPLQYSMSFLAKTVVGIASLWPHAEPEMSADLRRVVDSWFFLAVQGVKGLGQ